MEEKQRTGLRKGVMILSLLLCAGMCAAVGVPMVRLAREPAQFRIINAEPLKAGARALGLDENVIYAPYLT